VTLPTARELSSAVAANDCEVLANDGVIAVRDDEYPLCPIA